MKNTEKENERLDRRRKVIKLLKNKSMRYTEIVKETGILESTLDRILKELKKLGLAAKDERKRLDYWRWYTYTKKYNRLTYDKAIEHAKLLMPGFQSLLEFGEFYVLSLPPDREEQIKRRILSNFAEQHLKTGYPTIYKNLISFRELNAKLEKLKEGEVGPFIKKLAGRLVIVTEINWKSLRKTLWPKENLVEEPPFLLGPFKEQEIAEITEGRHGRMSRPPLLVGHGGLLFTKELSVDPSTQRARARARSWFIKGPVHGKTFDEKTFESFLQTEESAMKVYRELAAQIYILKFQVEHGQPLESDCGLCPDIIIQKEDEHNQIGTSKIGSIK